MKKEIGLALILSFCASQSMAGFFDSASSLLDSASKATAVASDVMSSTDEKVESVEGQVPTTADLTSTALDLLPALTQNLGVTSEQASGGMGSLLQMAQGTLSGSDFSTLSQSVPNVSDLLAAAPQVAGVSEESKGMASGLMNMAGLPGDALSSAATVSAQFKALGLSPTMIPQYIQVANQFFQSQGGQQTVDLFSKGVASLL